MMIDLTENIINCICHKREMGCLSIIRTQPDILSYHYFNSLYLYIFFYCYWTGTGIKILSIEINTRTFYFYVLFVISSVVSFVSSFIQCLIPLVSRISSVSFTCAFVQFVQWEIVQKEKNMDYNHWQESFLIYCQACVNTGVI